MFYDEVSMFGTSKYQKKMVESLLRNAPGFPGSTAPGHLVPLWRGRTGHCGASAQAKFEGFEAVEWHRVRF